MIDITKECCGCSACVHICPKEAIKMTVNVDGFFTSVIDKNLCIDCGKCDKVCPIINKSNALKTQIAYACVNNDEKIREISSSGGIFFILANYVINQNGVVFGCELNGEMNIVHSYVENMDMCKKYIGSKYAQSNMVDTFKQCKKFLLQSRLVLFSGTPCQINALKLFLNKEYDNLITVDFICHGVPSPKVFKKNIAELENKEKSKLVYYNFRDKTYGWKKFSQLMMFDNHNKIIQTFDKNIYMELFLSNICLNNSCYNCSSNGSNRRSDLTLADFWGVENKYPEMFDDKGTSLLLVNNIKGKGIFDRICSQMKYIEVDIAYVQECNPCLLTSVKKHVNREKFFAELDNKSLAKLKNKYCEKKSIKIFILKILRKFNWIK